MTPKKTQQVCDEHGPYEAVSVTSFRNKIIYMGCPKCAIEREKKIKSYEADMEAARTADISNALLTRSNIPGRFSRKSFNDFKARSAQQRHALRVAAAYANKFRDHWRVGRCLIFCGLPGTGKTHLACSIGHSVLKTLVPVHYVTAFTAIQKVKESYAKKTRKSEREIIESYQDPILLIIDEVGVQYGSDTDKLILYQIINGRYEKCRPTIMVSNFDETELGEYVGVRCMDRMREGGGVVVPFEWESYRK